MEIAIISDTHLPRGNRRLPQECIERLKAADLIVHAGDFVQLSVLREFERYGEVVAVHGNIDDRELRGLLPARNEFTAGGARIGVVHDAGPARGRVDRLRRWFPDHDAVVFGHSHVPLHEAATGGFQIFNPGSPTERRRAPERTMGIGRIEEGRIGFELVSLPLTD
jgi:putative phosphoesterase